MDDKTCVVLQFYLGDDDDVEVVSHQFHTGEALPRVGDRASVYETRDSGGDYVYQDGKLTLEGTVTRIDHCYEQCGMKPSEWRLNHFISVYVKADEAS